MENEAGEVGRGKLWRAFRIMLRSLASFQEEWEIVEGFYVEKQHDQIDFVKKNQSYFREKKDKDITHRRQDRMVVY